MEVAAGLKVLEQVLALLAAVAVQHVDGQTLEVEIDAVAEQKHQRNRHDDDNEQAAHIAQNLDDLFLGHSGHAREAHALTSCAASCVVVSETNTSSRVGRIFSMRLTVTPRSERYFSIRGIASAALRTTR